MPVTSARVLDAQSTRLAATIDGTEWSGIACQLVNGILTITSDGEIPNAVKAWIAAGNTPTPYAAPAPTIADIATERERRLALGFNYSFPAGDARGTIRIGTTASDMAGWSEVTTASQAAIALGQPNLSINVVADSAPVTVTAMEWQQILLAAAAFRQPIWAASFALEAVNPIPADYAAATRWPAVT